MIGLAEAGGEALSIAKEVYVGAYDRFDELTTPYESVIDIDKSSLPTPQEVCTWNSHKYVHTLRHDQSNADYNQNFRQLIHVGFKIAAEMGDVYTEALKANESIIAKNVTENIWKRHILPIFEH